MTAALLLLLLPTTAGVEDAPSVVGGFALSGDAVGLSDRPAKRSDDMVVCAAGAGAAAPNAVGAHFAVCHPQAVMYVVLTRQQDAKIHTLEETLPRSQDWSVKNGNGRKISSCAFLL